MVSLGCEPWNKGKKLGSLPEERKQKLSEAFKGEKNPFFGKHHSEETRQKLKDAWQRRKNKKQN